MPIRFVLVSLLLLCSACQPQPPSAVVEAQLVAPIATNEFDGVDIHVGILATEGDGKCDQFKANAAQPLADLGANIIYHDNYGGTEPTYPFFDIVVNGQEIPFRYTGKLTPDALRDILKNATK